MNYGKLIPVFVSSRQQEFAAERAQIQSIVEAMPVFVPEMMERWRPARVDPETHYLELVRSSFLFVGLYGCSTSKHVEVEYNAAAGNNFREILIYVRKCESRSPELQAFLDNLHQHTLWEYTDWESEVRPHFEKHLWEAVADMLFCYRRLAEGNAASRGRSDDDPLQEQWLAEQKQIEEILPVLPVDPAELQRLIDRLEKEIRGGAESAIGAQ